ncbi:MAG: nitrate reductase cytochrome c-type subunit [Lentisphaeria bacterium]|nr:nitrate reductase cytochrome c-type subunit [Lentisphaeria bacterium]
MRSEDNQDQLKETNLFVIAAITLVILGAILYSVQMIVSQKSEQSQEHVLLIDSLPTDTSHHVSYIENQVEMQGHERTLVEWYAGRAYSGAPPVISHPIDNEMPIQSDCLSCHKNGGYTPKFEAYAPVTPHPELIYCRQCHVPKDSDTLFRENTFEPGNPRLTGPIIPGGPPQIPHSIWMRDNCISCHNGPSSPPEIRTGHPERINCRQCHVPMRDDSIFRRKATTE